MSDPEPLRSWSTRLTVASLVTLVRLYQFTAGPMLGLLLGSVCRFEPSCSHYMIASLRKYGPIKGLARGLARIGRCHPWHPGGYDPP